MPLNKLENFIKNSEGRILYVNPNDLDATDGIENQGNSLTKPFKTLQRALLESARFSYLRGNDNDIVEKTTILLFPGEHLVDNRPGFGIKNESGVAKAISPNGSESGAQNTLTLTLNSNFDLTQEDNILYKFNSTEGGVIIPRGTSVVGLDLRKTKIRPKYVPNPTDENVKGSALFRVTGACYFWQFTIFDGDENTLVYTDPTNFDLTNRSKPVFSHHKLTVFEYADGINKLDSFGGLTDLDVYYSKLSNAYNRASSRDIDQKFPSDAKSFAKQRPEYEIVGAFSSDRIQITALRSGDGATPGPVVTVTTAIPHELTGGTPIKIEKVNVPDYNISTKVQSVLSDTQFTYLLPQVDPFLPAGVAGGLSVGNATVSVEVDTVTGASPYIFNCSLRSVYGMQGMKADGSKATGFKSMVVAQFTGVSLQKDDRAFTKYNARSRDFDVIDYTKQTGETLSSKSSSPNPSKVYHLDKDAVYRNGWKTAHITLENDAVLQIVSVFAIGYHIHFLMKSGGDASITNSNSNFGQFALAADGFKKESFDKDNKGFITSVITPKAVVSADTRVDLPQLDKARIVAAANDERIYLLGQDNKSVLPSEIAQGFRIGAKVNEKLYIEKGGSTWEAKIVCSTRDAGDNPTGTSFTSEKAYEAIHNDTTNNSSNAIHKITIAGGHELSNGESIRIFKDNADLPEGLDPHKIYYAITDSKNSTRQDGIQLNSLEIQIAASKTNAERTTPAYINTISSPDAGILHIISRVSDKDPGEIGHPMQFDNSTYTIGGETKVGGWFIHVEGGSGNTIYANRATLSDTNDEIPYILRKSDSRSLDDKLYKFRYVIPKELKNARDPQDSFVIQESSDTNVRDDVDFTLNDIITDSATLGYDFERNTRFISYLDYNVSTKIVTIRSDKNHNLNPDEVITLKNLTCTVNPTGIENRGYNGTFKVISVIDSKTFTYKTTDILDVVHNVGTWNNDVHTRSLSLPRFQRNNNDQNLFIYRSETINKYVEGSQDGVYHLYVLNGGNKLEKQFTDSRYNQNVVNLYPELDRDNVEDNPQEATSYAKRFPLGDVVTNDLKKSITRETANKALLNFGISNRINNVTNNDGTSPILNLDKEHDLQGLNYGGTLTGGSGHTDGTYHNIKLFDDASAPASAVWKGATAKVVVSGGVVTEYEIEQSGSAYSSSLSPLYFDSSLPSSGGIGGAPSSNIAFVEAGITTATGNYVQVTGISTGTDAYYRINAVPSTKSIAIKKPLTDRILDGQQVIDLGPWVAVSSAALPSPNPDDITISTVTCTAAHGLLEGNSFRVLDNNDNNLGDFIVSEVIDVTSFKVDIGSTTDLVNPTYILKHGMSSNNAGSDKAGENLGTRGLSFFEHENLILGEEINSATSDKFTIKLSDGTTTQESIESRLPLGSYIQIDGEIMRVVKRTLSSGKITVLRGALGTIVDNHVINSQIKKIKPIPIELRRPSILRASGHTFEYLGYGPGNYSTALPQVQLKTPTEREEFLSQSQETSCGTVVYTGMNDKGDFYIGNTKISSDSGEQITFDIPVPTVTGEDPSQLSVVFDEVIIKQRLLVEGGSSKQILSQFDGPVTFNGKVRFNETVTITKDFTVDAKTFINDSTDSDPSTTVCTTGSQTLQGAFTVKGGVGIGKRLNVCGDTKIFSTSETAFTVMGGVSIGGDTSLGGDLTITGTSTFGDIKLPDNKKAYFGTGLDMEIFHDGTDSIIKNDNGILKIQGGTDASEHVEIYTGSNVALRAVNALGANAIQLMYNGATKLQTSNNGVGITGDLSCTGDITAYFSPSDSTLKDSVTPISNALDKVISISGNTFTWKEFRDQTLAGTQDTGVIAQEVEALGLPGLVRTNEDGHKSVSYQKLIPVLIEAIKELSAKVDALS